MLARRERRFAIAPTQTEIEPGHDAGEAPAREPLARRRPRNGDTEARTETDYGALFALTLTWLAIGAVAAVVVIVALSVMG